MLLVIFFILVFVLVIIVLVGVLVVIGNMFMMKVLAKSGVAVFCGDMKKDFELLKFVNPDALGWIRAHNICYAPIMSYAGGKYLSVNFLGKPSKCGEIYISQNKNIVKLRGIANQSENTFQDLCVLLGSAKGISEHMRSANFSSLDKFGNNCDKNREDVVILDKGRARYFKFMCKLNIDIGEDGIASIPCLDRDKFITEVQNLTGLKNTKITNDILILRCSMDIKNLTVFLVEMDKGGYV